MLQIKVQCSEVISKRFNEAKQIRWLLQVVFLILITRLITYVDGIEVVYQFFMVNVNLNRTFIFKVKMQSQRLIKRCEVHTQPLL